MSHCNPSQGTHASSATPRLAGSTAGGIEEDQQVSLLLGKRHQCSDGWEEHPHPIPGQQVSVRWQITRSNTIHAGDNDVRQRLELDLGGCRWPLSFSYGAATPCVALRHDDALVHQSLPFTLCRLTRVLQECIGGNARTTLIIACSPSVWNEMETLGTLRFGT